MQKQLTLQLHNVITSWVWDKAPAAESFDAF